ncbi:MAG: maltodextrin phosphorylase, partial [Nitrospirae bacterium]|nr:maltodextrin phosphorylase [Nitrospirota bacterium]
MKPQDLSEYRYHHHGLDRESLKKSLVNLLIYSLGKDHITATRRDWFHTTALAVRERLIERWMETMRSYYRADA